MNQKISLKKFNIMAEKQTFKYTLSVQTHTQAESIQVMDAVTKLIKNVSPNDLELFANKVAANPNIIQTAKKWL